MLLYVWVALLCAYERDRKRKKNDYTEFLSSVLMLVSLSGPQQPPGGFRAAPGLSGGQEDQGVERRHQVDVLTACRLHQVLLKYTTQKKIR